MSRQAVHAVRKYYDAFLIDGDTRWDYWLDRVETTRERLATLLQVSAEEIAFMGNASQGLNHVADVLRGSGAVAALTGEFPSVTLPWIARGRSIRFLDSLEQVEDLDSDTAVLAVSLVQYKTGERLALEHVSKMCRQRRIRLVVDATQGFGVHPLDLRLTPVDALVFSGYKWANAGYGIAPLYVRRSLLEESGLVSAGWRSAPTPYDLNESPDELTTEARGLELGHPPFAGIAALGGALDLIEAVGVDHIEVRVLALVEKLRAGLEAMGAKIVSPRGSAITMISDGEAADKAAVLAEQRIIVSARGSGLRVSVHYYNDENDIQKFLTAYENY